MQFSKSFPDELRSQIAASDVVGKRVALTKKGKEFSGLCPFHNEKTPSFTVNDQKGFYHCFGCAAHGDIVSFTMQIERLGFKEAVIKLANDYGITIPVVIDQNQDHQHQEKIERDYLLLENICKFFEANLFSSAGVGALEYLRKRGLNNSQIKKFRLGFALDSYESLLRHLKSQGFSDAELLACGVIAKNDKGQLYDKFRGRIIFPIKNRQGKIIAFGGRILGDGQPKYLNSSETELFKKGQNLYNFSDAKKAIYEQKFVVVVEGYMDAISLSVNGIENVVAPLGTALTADQLKILFKTTSDVVVCLDGDKAGISAMRRTIDLALPIINHQNLVRFALLPGGFDPDDFVKQNGRDVTQNFLRDAENLSKVLFDFEVQDLHLDLKSASATEPEKKVILEGRLMQKVDLISDANSKKYFSQYYKNLLFEMGRNKNFSPKNPIAKTKIFDADKFDKQDGYSIAIIAIIANFPELRDYQDEICVLRDLEFKNQKLSDLKDHLINFFDQNPDAKFLEIKTDLEKIISDRVIKNKIFSAQFSHQNLENIKNKLKIFLLQYFYEEVSQQYAGTLAAHDEIETDLATIKSGKQKELFDYKTSLEKKILRLISDEA
ncbi:MAG: primase [Rickettsiaceae bacterium]|jgi:DNA primase|nr:primase [Rickettsiaceae bacterium]